MYKEPCYMRKQPYTHTWTRALILRASPRDFPWNNFGYPTLCFPAQSLRNCLCSIINVGRFRFACLYQKKSQKCQVLSHISQLLLSHVVQPIAFGVSLLLQSQFYWSLLVTSRWKETIEIEIGDWNCVSLLHSQIWISHLNLIGLFLSRPVEKRPMRLR